jgi:DNA mismatch repair protein MutS2
MAQVSEGVAALLGMLNSCASNVTVVNIDNGFGAAMVASLIKPIMNFSIGPLEFERLKELVSRYLATDFAKAMLRDVQPSTNLQELEAGHELTAEAMQYLREHRVAFRDIPLLPWFSKNLKPPDLLWRFRKSSRCRVFSDTLKASVSDGKRTASTSQDLPQRRMPYRICASLHSISAAPFTTARSNDRYSPELARIRRSLDAARSRVTEKLEGMVRNPTYAAQLQDQLVTVRNGRFVIPVRSDQKRGVDGIVHGTSSSGATVVYGAVGRSRTQ